MELHKDLTWDRSSSPLLTPTPTPTELFADDALLHTILPHRSSG